MIPSNGWVPHASEVFETQGGDSWPKSGMPINNSLMAAFSPSDSAIAVVKHETKMKSVNALIWVLLTPIRSASEA